MVTMMMMVHVRNKREKIRLINQQSTCFTAATRESFVGCNRDATTTTCSMPEWGRLCRAKCG